MATIYNSDLTKELIDSCKLAIGVDKIPSQIAEKVVPVVNVNPKDYRVLDWVRDGIASNATATTLTTLPTDRDTYLTSATLSVIKDVTATSILTQLRVVINGANREILSIPGFTLTVQDTRLSVTFSYPIKLDRGSIISIIHSTNVANVKGFASMHGFQILNNAY